MEINSLQLVFFSCMLLGALPDYVPSYLNDGYHPRLSNTVCKHFALEDRVAKADLIFSATIQDDVKDNKNNLLGFNLIIKRMIKFTNTTKTRKLEKWIFVDVRGREKKIFCESEIRRSDTRIFFVEVKEAYLLESVEKISLRTIKQIEQYLGYDYQFTFNKVQVTKEYSKLNSTFSNTLFIPPQTSTILPTTKNIFNFQKSTKQSTSKYFISSTSDLPKFGMKSPTYSKYSESRSTTAIQIVAFSSLSTSTASTTLFSTKYTQPSLYLKSSTRNKLITSTILSSVYDKKIIDSSQYFGSNITVYMLPVLNSSEFARTQNRSLTKIKIIPQVIPRKSTKMLLANVTSATTTTRAVSAISAKSAITTSAITTYRHTLRQKTTTFQTQSNLPSTKYRVAQQTLKKRLTTLKKPNLPKIISPPKNQTILINSSALFTCHVIGVDSIIFWTVNGSRWTGQNAHKRSASTISPPIGDITGLRANNQSSLKKAKVSATVMRLRGTHAGQSAVSCVVESNGIQQVAANSYLLVINNQDEIENFPRFHSFSTNSSTFIGLKITIYCEGEQSSNQIHILWYKNNALIKNRTNIIVQNGSLTILNAAKTDSGFYECRLENKIGTISKFIQIKVLTDLCVNKTCLHFSECIQTSSEEAKCICPSNCSRMLMQNRIGEVCANDEKTYESECAMKLRSCHSMQALHIRR